MAIIIFTIGIYAQNEVTEARFHDQYQPVEIADFPAALLPQGASELLFAVSQSDFMLHLFLKNNDGYRLVQSFPEEIMFNYAKAVDVRYIDGLVEISSEMPFRATVLIYRFEWTGEQLVLKEETSEDFSAELLAEGDSLLEAGKVSDAIDAYNGMMYPQAYMNSDETALKIIKKAHENALNFYKQKKYVDAASMMKNAFDYYGSAPFLDFQSPEGARDKLSDYEHIITADEFFNILADYGLFLLRAGMRELSIEINEYVIMLDESITGPYLQLGDAYYDANKKGKAKEYYGAYIRLMKNAGKENSIPERVHNRI